MTPAARLSAAIEILDDILAGAPAERTLTNWARAHRFAGSGDRAAIRDHVFDCLRSRGSFAALGQGTDGRALVLGLVRSVGDDPARYFTGETHAPAPLTASEAVPPSGSPDASLDWPEWMRAQLKADLGPAFEATTTLMRKRAPVFLRVNAARVRRDDAALDLAREGIETRACPLCETALEVTGGARRIAASAAYRDGLVELQDAASQAAVKMMPLENGNRVLDFCSGGGGKALAITALAPKATVFAHDIDAGRMADLPARAARAGVRIRQFAPDRIDGQFDVVLVDAPCSGSGTWRRTPDAKWRLTPERLAELVALQGEIVEQAARFLKPEGVLVYMTCSLFRAENEDRIDDLRNSGWSVLSERRFLPQDGGDGFFAAALRRV